MPPLSVAHPIQTPRLTLRPFTHDDLDSLYAIQSRPDVARYLFWNARTRDEVREALAREVHLTSLINEGDVLSLAVTEKHATSVMGSVVLFWRSVEHEQGEIGWVFHPDYQGRGFATEAARALLDLAFDRLGLHRVYARMDARNTASAAVARRLGMRQEAHFVQNERFKGEWGDELVFALLKSEWGTNKDPAELDVAPAPTSSDSYPTSS